MAFPQIAATANSQESTAVLSHDVSLPSGITAGDLLVIVFAYNSNPTIDWTLTGFTELFEDPNGTNAGIAVAYRFADGSEGATVVVVTSTTQRSQHWAARITGAHASSPPEYDGVDGGQTTATPTPPNLAPSWGAEDTLWLAITAFDLSTDANITLSAYPTNYTNGFTATVAHTSGVGLGVARRELNAASDNPLTFTISASENCESHTIAVRSSAGIALVPGPVATPTAIPTPSLALTSDLAPATVVAAAAMPAPAITLGELALTPDPAAASIAVPAPTITAAYEVAPSPVALPAAVPVPQLSVGIALAPDPVQVTMETPSPTLSFGFGVVPDAVLAPLVVPAPTVSIGDLQIAPTSVTIPAALPAFTLASSLSLTPPAIGVAAGVVAPSVAHSLALLPTPAPMPTAVPVPTLDRPLGLTPPALPVVVAFPAPFVGTPLDYPLTASTARRGKPSVAIAQGGKPGVAIVRRAKPHAELEAA